MVEKTNLWPFCGMSEDQFVKVLGDALQTAWGDFCSDTGCFPDNFEWRGGKGTLSADFSGGAFVRQAAISLVDTLKKEGE